MGYYNPVLAYGESRYVADAADAGADGFIVPDLPLEESQPLEKQAQAAGLVLIRMLAPTSHARRVSNAARGARGFLYLVSLTGVTGARSTLAAGLSEFVDDVRQVAAVPLAVGFGIGNPQQAAQVAAFADGIIVGSALIDAGDRAPGNEVPAATSFVKSMQDALRK
jgi:tryptophan synthase alpha chain